MWAEVLARFEKKAPAGVMATLVLEQAVAAEWVDQVFEEHRQRQYLLTLARNVQPKAVAKSKRGPKVLKSREWLEGKAVNAHVSTDRVLKAAKVKRP